LGVTFLAQPAALVETRRQPYHARYNMHRHPRLTPAIQQVSVTGPFGASTAQDTPSRRRIFVEWPTSPADEDSCARRILDRLVRKAYRRPVAEVDCLRFFELYREAKTGGGFEAGIEAALAGLLASPEFLFRLEPDDPGAPSGSVRRLGAIPLASRVSFLIWSSLPDEALLAAAEDDTLLRTEVLRSHVLRLLADSRSANLASNFAGQWLQLRNLDAFSPDLRLHPDFDENLRRSFRGETERLFREIVAEDRSVLELLRTDHTFLDERLAKHYGIPHVYGPRFRRVAVASEHRRGGILRHGGILCVTSYATRTSPVLRGNWILGNLLGTPPPPPPPNVPPLRENAVAESTSVRERLARHRADPACAGCHRLMDPVGFALENFDAIGRWRDSEDGTPLDASGGLPDGSSFVGVDGLEDALAKRPDLFVGTLVEKLLVFALGRGLTASDAPAVRAIVREAEADDYRFSSIISGIVRSTPFTHRKTP
ncbi:MAG: DUF1592 domain-containing protein, partial [Verrucomicrobiales bacterium]|nr:DUF1592 domain-containing protein [Verrucomicrobiales bacterium]